MAGRECSLADRWVLISMCVRTPAPLRRANVRGALPFPLPLALPLPKRPVGAERCLAFGPSVFMRGARPFPPPRTPLPLCVSVCVCGCVHRLWVWWSYPIFYSGRFGGGARGPSVVLRPARFGPHAGCRPMSPAPRPRPPMAYALGRGARRGGILGSLRSLRFKCPRVRAPAPSRLALARFRPTSSIKNIRFCHFQLANGIACR